jgi:hypothetical protein
MYQTGLLGTLTLGASGTTLSGASCYLAGDVTVNFIADSTLLLHYLSGQLTLANMIAGSVASITAGSTGNLIVDASCTGGTVIIRGNAVITDNSGGAVTIVDQTITNVTVAEQVWAYDGT